MQIRGEEKKAHQRGSRWREKQKEAGGNKMADKINRLLGRKEVIEITTKYRK